MHATDVTAATLPEILASPARRAELLRALSARTGTLDLSNSVSDAAVHCQISSEQLDVLVTALLVEDASNHVLDCLVSHPAMSDQGLARVLDAGRCRNALGHRPGPEWLLLRMAEEHAYPESILTLALRH